MFSRCISFFSGQNNVLFHDVHIVFKFVNTVVGLMLVVTKHLNAVLLLKKANARLVFK